MASVGNAAFGIPPLLFSSLKVGTEQTARVFFSERSLDAEWVERLEKGAAFSL